MEYKPNFEAKPVDCLRGIFFKRFLHTKQIFLNVFIFLEYTHFLDAIGVKRLNSGIGIDITDFATNNFFCCLDLNPEQCNNSHLHSKSNQNFFINIQLYLTFIFILLLQLIRLELYTLHLRQQHQLHFNPWQLPRISEYLHITENTSGQ